MSARLGHNNGPTMEPGFGWRKTAWTKARRDLLPSLPIEVLRLRVKRARMLGLDYKTYASVRASTGRDVVGFLFSTNALGVLRPEDTLPEPVAQRLQSISEAARVAMTQGSVWPQTIPLVHLDAAYPAPGAWDCWSDIRTNVQRALHAEGLPADGTLVVGVTTAERDWSQAGRTAGFVSAERFFASG